MGETPYFYFFNTFSDRMKAKFLKITSNYFYQFNHSHGGINPMETEVAS